MNDKSDLPKLQSIVLGSMAISGDSSTSDSSSLTMESMDDKRIH